MDGPDTTEAVAEALTNTLFHFEPSYGNGNASETAQIAIQADRKALADAGYVIVKREPLVELLDCDEIADEWAEDIGIEITA